MDFGLPPDVQHWTMQMLGKDYYPTVTRSVRSNSGSISPDYDDERVRISYSREQALKELEKQEIEYPDRYLSSEEDLSPMEEDYDDSETFQSFEMEDEDYSDVEKTIEAYASEAWSTDLAARTVSIIFTGRPKVVDVVTTPCTSPTVSQIPSRDSSLNKNGNNRARPRPIIQNNRVSRLSGSFEVPPKSEWRRSSLYAIASPTSPRFFSTRRSSVADSKNFEESVATPTILEAPPVPDSPESDIPPTTPRHARFKSLHRLGLFKGGSKKERKDSLTSASVVQLTPTPSPSMFAPSPFIRPQTAKLVARGADERESTMAMAAMFNGDPPRGMGIQEEEETFSEDSSSWNERGSSMHNRIRRRRSLNLL